MKKTVLFFLMIILIASCHQEEIPSVSDKPEGNQLIFDLSDEDVLQGCIYVKLKEEPTEEVQVRSIGNTVRTGIKASFMVQCLVLQRHISDSCSC